MSMRDYTNTIQSVKLAEQVPFAGSQDNACPACKAPLMGITCLPGACGCPSLNPRMEITKAPCSGGGNLCTHPRCGYYEPCGFSDERSMRLRRWTEERIALVKNLIEEPQDSLSILEQILIEKFLLFAMTGDSVYGGYLHLDVQRLREKPVQHRAEASLLGVDKDERRG